MKTINALLLTTSLASFFVLFACAPVEGPPAGHDSAASAKTPGDGSKNGGSRSSGSGAGSSGSGEPGAVDRPVFQPSNIGAGSFAGTGDVRITESECTVTNELEDGLAQCVGFDVKYQTAIEKQVDGSDVLVFYARSFSFEAGSVVHVDSTLPIAFVAERDVRIDGSIILTKFAEAPSAGGFLADGSGGPGVGGAGVLGSITDGSGGGSYCGQGGNGGGTTRPGSGGAVYGDVALVPLMGGSAGGGGAGGGGGGAIQLVAGGTIAVGASGAVSAPGGPGRSAFAGGGGSGGAILLEASAITIAGVLAANGGAGNLSDDLRDAEEGHASASPARGPEVTAGDGSAGSRAAGGNGSFVPGDRDSHGAGGGGAGRIRLNSRSGVAMITATGVLSPSLATRCATQGKLAP